MTSFDMIFSIRFAYNTISTQLNRSCIFLHKKTFAFEMGPTTKRKASSSANDANDAKKQKSLDMFVTKTVSPTAIEMAVEVKTTGDTDGNGLLHLLTDQVWKQHLKDEFKKPYFKSIEKFLSDEYGKGKEIFPPRNLIFNALNLTPLDKVKVVILGQDPYHDNGQAHGLSFSVPSGISPPPSLKNIYKELTTDIEGFKMPTHGCLEKWAKRGVLLLNATLTVEAHKPNSHANAGWQTFTDAAIKIISGQTDGVVFILWGGFAQKKGKLISSKKHFVINAAHPSPLSVTKFFGCKCFSKANEALAQFKKDPVDWNLD